MENQEKIWALQNSQPVQSNDCKNKYNGDIKPIIVMTAINSILFALFWLSNSIILLENRNIAKQAVIAPNIVSTNDTMVYISFWTIVLISFISFVMCWYIMRKIKSKYKHSNTLNVNKIR